MQRKITYAAIDYNFAAYLGTVDDLDVDLIPEGQPPAAAYNEFLETASGIVCFLHADTTSRGLDAAIRRTIAAHGIGVPLGVVGAGSQWARRGIDITSPTCDGCLIVVDSDRPERFDSETFDGWHLYAEDYCCQFGGCRLIDLNGYEWYQGMQIIGTPWFVHHSHTMHREGGAWGDYGKYKKRLNEKWQSNVATT